jgi:hypothetical protein
VERAQTPSVGCIVFVQQGKFIGTFMQNHAGTAHHQPAKQHMYVTQRKPILFQITCNRFVLLLRKPRLGSAGVGTTQIKIAREKRRNLTQVEIHIPMSLHIVYHFGIARDYEFIV